MVLLEIKLVAGRAIPSTDQFGPCSFWVQNRKSSMRSAVGTVITDRPPPRSVRAEFRTRLPPCVSDGELAVRAPAPVTRIFGTVSEACFAGSHSPWPPPWPWTVGAAALGAAAARAYYGPGYYAPRYYAPACGYYPYPPCY